MSGAAVAVHRSILCVDVENFGDLRRTDLDQTTVRAGLYGALRQALAASGVSWDHCYREDRGDGVLVLVPPAVPKAHLVTGFPQELVTALTAHNRAHGPGARIRLRAALHAGEIRFDAHGVVGRSINLTFRLLEADPAKSALRSSRGVLALIASKWFFHEVIRQEPAAAPDAYKSVRIAVKETVAEAWVRLPDHLGAPAGEDAGHRSRLEREPAVGVPRQLPGAVRDFVGRERELAVLKGLLDEPVERGPGAAVAVITGTAGVGKTALAVHWARAVGDQFPDGELYINLRGHGPDPPIPAEEALDRMLRALDVAVEKIPAGVEAKAALYRSLLDGRRLLVVLDNAADVKQVRPLLPGTSGCVVVVTSRNRLSGLIARDGARSICLDRLAEDEAVALLREIIGAAQVDADPVAAAKVALRCDCLPLALRVAAERAATRRHSTLTDVADELAGEQNRLDILDTDDEYTAVRTAFSWTYRALPPRAAHVFRLLGLHRGPDISLDAIAALVDATSAEVQQVLDLLTSKHLLEETARDRFRLHDLLRCYAEECARAQETDQERANAVRRLLAWYLYTANNASRKLVRPKFAASLTVADGSRRPQTFTTYSQAQHWCETERLNLVTVIRQAANVGHHDIAWKLSVVLTAFFHHRKYLADWIVTLQVGLASARYLRDRTGEGYVLSGFGFAYHDHQFEESMKYYRQALTVFLETGDRPGQGWAIHGIGHGFRGLRLFAESIEHYQEALSIFREIDNQLGQGVALFGIGFAYVGLRQFEQAIDCFQRVVNFVDNDPRTEGWALHGLGYGYRGLRRFEESIECYQQALLVFREIGDWRGQGEALHNLGKAQADIGRKDIARQYWTEALAVFRELNDPREAEVCARLDTREAAGSGRITAGR